MVTCIILNVEILLKEALTIAHCDRLFFIDTEYFCDVVAVQLKIGDYAKVVEALEGHQKDKADGSDLFHDSNIGRKAMATV